MGTGKAKKKCHERSIKFKTKMFWNQKDKNYSASKNSGLAMLLVDSIFKSNLNFLNNSFIK